MQTATLPPGNGNSKQWPDFYSILGSSPKMDSDMLRQSINALYVKANEQSDHRELNTRFYNQVLSQKVLPQCRRILLNEVSREAYDRQWHLHREGAESALSYPDFIREISKDAGTARALSLSDDEISLLPSFGVPKGATEHVAPPATETPVAAVPVAAPTTGVESAPEAVEVVEGVEVTEAEKSVSSPLATSRADNSVVVSPTPPVSMRRKPPPVLPILGGFLVLVIGGFFWNASQHKEETVPAAPVVAAPVVAAPVVAAAVAPIVAPAVAPPVSKEGATAHRFSYKAAKKLQNVSLVGSFNNWNKTTHLMVVDSDKMTWHLTLLLKPGRYPYKFAPFAPQEETWVVDPKAPLDTTDKINHNSLLIVR